MDRIDSRSFSYSLGASDKKSKCRFVPCGLGFDALLVSRDTRFVAGRVTAIPARVVVFIKSRLPTWIPFCSIYIVTSVGLDKPAKSILWIRVSLPDPLAGFIRFV
jgi:hypothetical protein